MMLRIAAAAAVAVPSSFASGQTSIRYDFTLEVISNTFSATDPGSAFAAVPVGSMGVLSIEASTTPIPGFGSADTLAYPILSTSAIIGGIDAALDQSGYPSTSFVTGLNVSNDADSSSPDLLGAILPSVLADVSLTLFTFGAPSLWDSTQLPTAIDVAAPGSQGGFTIDAANRVGSDGQLRTQFTDVEITLIPTPAGTTALAASLLFIRRRRCR
ncbi:MAG: hypothetical protein AAF937_07415 [Planctomycetota bacterium]